MQNTIYLVTHYGFNHEKERKTNKLDRRFLQSDKNYVFYLVDQQVPEELKDSRVLLEKDLDPMIHEAGSKYFGEWSFLLAEEKHAFCSYPFFMISSRFYEKNHWLYKSLDEEWDRLFDYLQEYGWGYLPSYDRPISWIDLSWKKLEKRRAWEYMFFPFTSKTFELTEQLFGVNIPKDYRYTPDLFCNYIGFRSRKELLEYISFYKPLTNYFFDSEYRLKKELSPYIKKTGYYRNEKPFTFFLEILSHLFFYSREKRYFALHYDGYYEIDEKKKEMSYIKDFPVSKTQMMQKMLQWKFYRFITYGYLAYLKAKIRKRKKLYQFLKWLLRKKQASSS